MNQNVSSIPISMLRQYCFCPRIPYFYLYKNISIIEKPWMSDGFKNQEKLEMLLKRRNLKEYGVRDITGISYDVSLQSHLLNIHGKCDGILMCQNEIIPLEFKDSEYSRFNRGARVQLCAYALLLEEKYQKPVTQAFLLYGEKGKAHKLPIDNELRQEFQTILVAVNKLLENCCLPQSSASEKQCCQCEFQNFCADRF